MEEVEPGTGVQVDNAPAWGFGGARRPLGGGVGRRRLR